ncbi:hypothetical protein ACF08N_02310 [Streptomyces sp. NPDC015127]|uniref:hypothetical protein n=1 Tax=Streptomyces sp. NPDC015127 TaxID=3364939 RepID=UPI0036FEEF28
MTVHQLPADNAAFARYLGELAERVDRAGGWCAIFRQRDPDGMRACLEGAEIPPWDVVESLLHDLATLMGPQQAERETSRARALHAAAAAAHDRLPGGREALEERRELMRGEQAYAASRAAELLRRLAAEPEGTAEAERLTHELSWTRDDHARATSRITELTSRLASLPREDAPPGWFAPPGHRGHGVTDAPDVPPVPAPAPDRAYTSGNRAAEGTDATRAYAGPGADSAVPAAGSPQGPGPRAGRKKKPRRGARFAGVEGDGGGAVAVPVLPVADDVPRGARYGGAASAPEPEPEPEPVPEPDGAARAARETVAVLGRLRAEGRTGEAHVVLCEAAARPPGWLPALAAELHRGGLDADWATLLWEVASQPAGHLAAAADALSAAGRPDDGRQLLRLGVTRPAEEIADAAIALADEGHGARARALLAAYAHVRPAEDAARVAARDPARLVPALLDAVRGALPDRERDLVHALRVAGYLGA